MYLAIVPNSPFADALEVIDSEPVAGPWALMSWTVGDPSFSHDEGAPRGLLGTRPGTGRPGPRPARFALRVSAASKDDLESRLSSLAAAVDALRSGGGQIIMRPNDATRRAYLTVLAGNVTLGEWGPSEDATNTHRPIIECQIAPLVEGDPMDWADPFTDDAVLATYLFDSGALGNLDTASGDLVPTGANLSTENRLIYTDTGYDLPDAEASINAAPGATLTNFKAGVILNRHDAATYVEGYVTDNGTSSTLALRFVGSGITSTHTVAITTRINSNDPFTVRLRQRDRAFTVEYFARTNEDVATPTHTQTIEMTDAQAAVFGPPSGFGLGGLVFTPIHASARITALELRPFSYRGVDRREWTTSDIPGDTVAKAEAWVSGGASAAPWGMIAWAPKPVEPFTLMYGDFTKSSSANSWDGTTSLEFLSAGPTTLSTSTTFSRYGPRSLSFTSASVGAGAERRLIGRWRRGRSYTFDVWVRGSAASQVRLRLGLTGDLADQSFTLSTSQFERRSVTWIPDVDYDEAYVAVSLGTAASTTIYINGPMIYEGASTAVAPTTWPPPFLPPFGYRDMLGRSYTSDLAAQRADATAEGGIHWWPGANGNPAGGGFSNTIEISPHLIGADDYTDTVEVEIWARFLHSSANTGGVSVAVPRSRDNQAGKLVPPVSATNAWKMVRCGVVSLPANPDLTSREQVTITWTLAAGTNNQPWGIDYYLLVNPRMRAAAVSGITSPVLGSEQFAPAPATGTTWADRRRIYYPDLSSADYVEYAAQAGASLAGALLEIPSGPLVLLMTMNTITPDDPGATASEAGVTGGLHLAVTPRYLYLPF